MKNIRIETRPVGSLVEDFSLYPRDRIKLDNQRVRRYRDALTNGAKFPPILILPDGRILDGWHRVRMYRDVHGDTHTISCEVWTGSLADGFLHATGINARHGIPFLPADNVHCAIAAEALGIKLPDVAKALCMVVDHLRDLVITRTAESPSLSQPVPLKRPFRPGLAGRKDLTETELAANRSSSGMMPTFYVNQLIDILNNDRVLDAVKSEGFVDRLTVLNRLIDEKILTPA